MKNYEGCLIVKYVDLIRIALRISTLNSYYRHANKER